MFFSLINAICNAAKLKIILAEEINYHRDDKMTDRFIRLENSTCNQLTEFSSRY